MKQIFSLEQLIDIFGYEEVLEQTARNVGVYQEKIKEYADEWVKPYLKIAWASDGFKREFWEWAAEMMKDKVYREWEVQLTRLKRNLEILRHGQKVVVRAEDVKRRWQIDKLAESYGLKLVRAGSGRMKVVCPFHPDKDPSLVLYLKNNSFFCFGCSAGGSVIDFVMHMDRVDFRVALRTLARG